MLERKHSCSHKTLFGDVSYLPPKNTGPRRIESMEALATNRGKNLQTPETMTKHSELCFCQWKIGKCEYEMLSNFFLIKATLSLRKSYHKFFSTYKQKGNYGKHHCLQCTDPRICMDPRKNGSSFCKPKTNKNKKQEKKIIRERQRQSKLQKV